MEMDACAARNSTWRQTDSSAGDAGTMETGIVPIEHYDSARAKIDANLRWLFATAYGKDHIPEDLREPFYVDQYEQEHIKPRTISLLLSGELYCRVCGLVLQGELAALLWSHQSVIQALARKGIYILESDTTPVSELDLSSVPIKMSAHIPLIDGLMLAYTVEMFSIERVVSSVKRFSSVSASKELPCDLEDAMLLWINKVNVKMREIAAKEFKIKQHLMESPSHQKSPSKWYWKLVPVRYRRDHLSGRTMQHFPMLDDLMKDVSDGAALLAVIHFYCPELLKLEDICLKEIPSIADSVYNIHLLTEFSNEYLNKSFYLKAEDMLYSPPVLKNNVMVFIAELFWWFEVIKPDFVQPRDLQDIKDVRSLLQPKSSRPHFTKQSFLSPADTLTLPPSPDLRLTPSLLSPSPSLQLRQSQQRVEEEGTSGHRNRTNSLTHVDGQAQGSMLAWAERRQRPLSQQVPYLHLPLEGDGDAISLARSISKDSLASTITNITPSHTLGGAGPHMHRFHPRGLPSPVGPEEEPEAELVAAVTGRRWGADPGAGGFYLEPLLPALARPAKEKSASVSKQQESGEERHAARGEEGRSVTEPEGASADNQLLLRRQRFSSVRGVSHDSNSDLEEEDGGEEEEKLKWGVLEGGGADVSESAKLREDLRGSERADKEGSSGRSSPSLSLASASSSSGGGVRMTSFSERRQRRQLQDGCSSGSSSAKTTPDGSEGAPWPPGGLPAEDGREPPDLVQLHMQMDAQRRCIQQQARRAESMLAQQRIKLGQAAFLHAVKGRSGTLPQPLRLPQGGKTGFSLCRDDSSLEALRPGALPGDGADLGECGRSIEFLSKAISSIQQQMLQLSSQQERLLKHKADSPVEPPECSQTPRTPPALPTMVTPATSPATDPATGQSPPQSPEAKACTSLHFVGFSSISPVPVRRHPKFSCGQRGPRVARRSKESPRPGSHTTEKVPPVDTTNGARAGAGLGTDNCSSTLAGEEPSQTHPGEPPRQGLDQAPPIDGGAEADGSRASEHRAQLMEVQLSVLQEPEEEEEQADITEEQRSVLGFFFKDEEKAEDEMAKRRAAFLHKQQRKAEEARLRKQQQEADSELKRDEARQKAEEERLRKEEEKARRELIKQEYLRRKQQELMEEQGLSKPRPRTKTRRYRPKSLHREQARGSLTPDLSHRGSSLSLATEEGSVASEGAQAHRAGSVCSVESFPMLSRASSRNMERDWENGSTASSITSAAEYNGPKLFKEPSSKSNKPIIINAITHCCLAGKVNEAQKNAVLEELDKCESNHLFILFRDGGCQYRAIYSYSPDSEEIAKFTGTGPRNISRKMIDKLYKYSSDRKQFNMIPAKTVSVSVDAVTIHNHLWHVKRPGSTRRK